MDPEEKRQLYYTKITEFHWLVDFDRVRELWRYRDLIGLFTKRSFQLSYKQTLLGPLWLFIAPVFSSLVFTVIFGGVAGIATDGIPHLLYYLLSTTVWNFFAGALSSNANTFTANAGIFGKVYFPRLVVPVSNVLSGLIRMGINFIMVIGLMAYYVAQGRFTPKYQALWMIPPTLLMIGMMGMSCGIIISSLTTKYRDLSVFVGFGLSLWMYSTPVVYPITQVSLPWLQTLLIYNPMTMPMEIFRYVFFGRAYFNLTSLLISIGFTLVITFFGVVLFHKVERNFMDTV